MLYAVPFDVDRLELTGEPVPVLEGVRRSTGVTGAAQFATSNNGTLIYIVGPSNLEGRNFSLATADKVGTVSPLPLPVGTHAQTRVSPDGKLLAVTTDDGRESIVWTYALGGTSPLRRVTLEGSNAFPVWSPDSRRLAFGSDRGGERGIYVQRVDGSGAAERLTTASGNERHLPGSWSIDGEHVVLSVLRDARYSLAVLSLRDKTVTPIPGVQSPEPLEPVFSPDGRWIAYAFARQGADAQSPNRGIFLQPFPPTGEVFQAPRQSLDFHPVWSRDGKELIFVPSAASERMAIVSVATRPTLTFGSVTTTPQRVTGGRLSNSYRAYDVMPDGSFVGLVSSTTGVGPTSTELRIVLNWFEELKQKVPARP